MTRFRDASAPGPLRSAVQRLGGRLATVSSSVVDRAVEVPGSLLDALTTDRHPAGETQAHAAFADVVSAAAENGEMFLVYQPEVDLRSRRIVAVEALVRWQHPTLGEIAPEAFIPLAEQSDVILALGTWVIHESLRDLAAWYEQMPGLEITLRVNVSPNQLADAGLVTIITEALAEHGVPGERLCIEITENFRVDDPAGAARSLEQLHLLGVTSALDDLASGFSSLGRLRALRTDALKIDRTLVADLDVDARARAIVAAVVGLATELDMEVIAEGVERSEEADALLALGCRRAQGHHLGRPMAATTMARLLTDDSPSAFA